MIEKDDLERMIVREHYYNVPSTTVTICTLTLTSGFNVVGKSACMDSRDFDEQLGREYARADAISQMWELEGYRQLAVQAKI